MKPFIWTVLGTSLSVVTFIYMTDPAYRWHRARYPQHALQKGEHWAWPRGNINETAAKLAFAKLSTHPDLVMLGSSRIVYPDYSMFRDDIKILNLAVGYASISKHVALWETVRTAGGHPTFVLLDLDPWTLTERWDVRNRYRAYEFSPHLAWRDMPELFNWASLKASAAYWWNAKEATRGYRSDGTIYRVIAQPASQVRLIREIETDIQSGQFAELMRSGALSEDTIERTEDLIHHMASSGAAIMILLPPLHPAALQSAQTHPQWSLLLENYGSAIQRIQRSQPATIVCNAMDPQTFGCLSGEFYDAIHMTDACAQKVLVGCFRKDPHWRELLKTGMTTT